MTDAAMSNPIERVYITGGDNTYNHKGVLCDKMAAVVINGDIYWLEGSYAYPWEIGVALRPLDIRIFSDGDIISESNRFAPVTNNKVTKIKGHIEEVLDNKSNYVKRAVFASPDKITWSVEAIKAKFFDPIEEPA